MIHKINPPTEAEKKVARTKKMRRAFDTIRNTQTFPMQPMTDAKLENALQDISVNLEAKLNLWYHKVRTMIRKARK